MDVLDMDVRNARRNPSAGIWLAAFLIIGLGLTIAVNFWFLHIILLAYFVLKFQRKRVWKTVNGDVRQCLIPRMDSEEKKNHVVFL
uniref:Uncharacterized protein n=1 Tax=Acrobeloides nanus TaxID=290746 RepID=A0A914EN99_9BILA